ncbi:hypothetical protein M407DRAFT_29272 [Tulasnella calospora MUT 4182]|uniref:CCHC-type domain-containing protein n=1 Tax=Tulasnella calospora MUT 4182 TaxID=1051891 RepID=A0A0C3Q991_9AGAM|nr:hypothetical protein M407DRAFT_29272 [Tulasnella calospora MUT 4182]
MTNGVSMDPSGDKKKITSQELAAMLINKDRHQWEKGGNNNALAFRKNPRTFNAPKDGKKKEGTCHNCEKTGHFKAECWSKGGGKEGQNPQKGQKHQGNGPGGN